MNHKTFLDIIKAAHKPDRYGWVTSHIGRFRFRTNGTEWACLTIEGNREVTRLVIVMDEWKRAGGHTTPKTTGQN